MTEKNKKFAVIIGEEVAFLLVPAPNAPQYERVIAAYSSDPKIVEVPLDHPDFDIINSEWRYSGGEFKSPIEYNPNVEKPE